MTIASYQSALHFLDSIDLAAPGTLVRSHSFAISKGDEAPLPAALTDPLGAIGLKTGVEQAFVDNEGVTSFTPDVSLALREATVLSCSLAWRVASKLYPDDKAANWQQDWRATYLSTLTNIGWLVQEETSFSHSQKFKKANVGEEIVAIITAVFGDKAKLLDRVIGLLKNMKKEDGLITLYKSRTVKSQAVQTSLQLATNTDKGFLLESVEFKVTAASADKTILVFSWGTSEAEYSYRNIKLTLSEELWGMIKPLVLAKVNRFITEDFQKLPDL